MSYSIEIGLRKLREVRSIGKVLTEETIRIFVRSSLPRTLRITKVDLYTRGNSKSLMSRGHRHDPQEIFRFVKSNQAKQGACITLYDAERFEKLTAQNFAKTLAGFFDARHPTPDHEDIMTIADAVRHALGQPPSNVQ